MDLRFDCEPVVVPRPDLGGVLVKPGKPRLQSPEVSVEEAARLCGVSHWTVRGWLREGKISARQARKNGKILIARDELEGMRGRVHGA